MIVSGGGESGEVKDEGQIVSGVRVEGAEVDQAGHENETIGKKAVFLLQIADEAGDAGGAIAFAEKELWRGPSLFSGGEEPNKFADGGDVFIYAEELLRFFAFCGPAESCGNGVDEDEVGGVEDGVGVIDDATDGAGGETFGGEVEAFGAESTEMEPDGGGAWAAIEAKGDRSGVAWMGGEAFAVGASGGVIDIEDIGLDCAVVFKDGDGACLGEIFDFGAPERNLAGAFLGFLFFFGIFFFGFRGGFGRFFLSLGWALGVGEEEEEEKSS